MNPAWLLEVLHRGVWKPFSVVRGKSIQAVLDGLAAHCNFSGYDDYRVKPLHPLLVEPTKTEIILAWKG